MPAFGCCTKAVATTDSRATEGLGPVLHQFADLMPIFAQAATSMCCARNVLVLTNGTPCPEPPRPAHLPAAGL